MQHPEPLPPSNDPSIMRSPERPEPLPLSDDPVTVLESSSRHTRTLVRRPLDADLSAWEGVSANAVLVSTVRLPAMAAHPSQLWETMAFQAFFRNGEMQVDYGELVCYRAATRDEAWQNHDRVVREFSEGPSDRDPATGIQYGDLN
jgi:hypothetical protein